MDDINATDFANDDLPQSNNQNIVTITANLAATFTFASHQNSIPVIRSIQVNNQTADSLEHLRLELTSCPPFLRAKTWIIDRIISGESVTLSDRRIDLDAAYLAGLDEAERGDITLRLLQRDHVLTETILPVRLLARDEWGGVADMGQLLPAFVMPNDPAVFKLLRSAAERLAAHGHSSALDGYQSNDPKRAYMLAAAIYSAIAGLGAHYTLPPASFESRSQKVRGSSKIVQDSLATCLDTTLLFAASLEATGLNAVALLFDGHALAGVWLVKRTLPRTIEDDVVEIRKAIAARELIVFETTGVTHRPAMTFEQARKLGEAKLDENAAQRFMSAIGIARSRSAGIMPLASHETPQTADQPDSKEPSDIPLPAEPDFPMPADLAEQKPTTAAGRIERWQTKLLDLSLRNRLLNFTDNKKTVSFVSPDVAYLEDRLAENIGIKLISLPEQNPLGERDAELHREKRGHDLHREFAAQALQRDELSSMLEARDLEARLESPFEEAVAAQLERRGWQVVPQVGLSGYRINLGIRHPIIPGFISPASNATVPRIIARPQRATATRCVNRFFAASVGPSCGSGPRIGGSTRKKPSSECIGRWAKRWPTAALEWRAAESDTSTVTDRLVDGAPEEAAVPDPALLTPDSDIAQTSDDEDLSDISTGARREIGERQVASSEGRTAESGRGLFATTDLSTFKADPDLFFEFSYRPTIQAMVDAVMDAEAPVRDDVLAQRVARAHGWLRTGARIREQIALQLHKLEQTNETTGTFLWKPGTVVQRLPFRKPLSSDHRRSLADISIAELTDFILAHPTVLDKEYPPLVYARLMQVDRLAAPSRDRIAEAITRAKTLMAESQ